MYEMRLPRRRPSEDAPSDPWRV
ncbi:MAG: hypothetical protein QOE24_1681, partial [Frankiales bacterium]|nr:hypothetical protein [Frankiales bacterium]